MQRFLFVLLSTIFLFGCKKDILPVIDCFAKTNDIIKVRKLMPGSYKWTYSIVNIMGSPTSIETPTSSGLNYKYIFYKDGTVDYYENDTLKTNDNYIVDYELKVTTYPLDSATVIIIKDKNTGQRKNFFRPWLCNDSARFYNPYNSIDVQRNFSRNSH